LRVKRYPALARVRLGCVQYLNSKPLIYGCDAPVTFGHPSELARDLANGALDVALVPVFEALRSPGYLAADDVAIACDGPVFSVFLAHRGPLAEVRRVVLDPASLTSVNLLRVLLAEFHGSQPEVVAQGGGRENAVLHIGNQAIDFRTRAAGDWQFLDLGAEWRRCTGLPFVFALWLIRPNLPDAAAVAEELRALKRDGLAHIPEIVRGDKEHAPELATRYLTEHIRFDCGHREKAGLERFRELLAKHGLIAEASSLPRFV
jgi:predicted solute-binding protein